MKSEHTQDYSKHTGDEPTRAAIQAAERAYPGMHDAAPTSKRALNQSVRQAANPTGSARGQTRHGKTARSTGHDRPGGNYVAEKPIRSVTMAAAAGVLLARLVGRRRKNTGDKPRRPV